MGPIDDTAAHSAATVRDMPAPSSPFARRCRRTRPGPLLGCVLGALLLGVCAPAAAIDYIVEVVLFEHRGLPVIGDDRYWVALPSERTLGLGSPEAEAAGFTPIDGPLGLAAEAERMRADGYRVLRHFAWRQPGLDEASAVPIRVNLGERIALWTPAEAAPGQAFLPASAIERDDRPRAVQTTTVAGTIKVRLGRFLHVEARLAYDDPATGTGYRLDESRRMRSRELHYLDNPRFGLLTRIVPVEEDEDLTPLAQDDEESPEPPAPADGLSEDGLPDVDSDTPAIQ